MLLQDLAEAGEVQVLQTKENSCWLLTSGPKKVKWLYSQVLGKKPGIVNKKNLIVSIVRKFLSY